MPVFQVFIIKWQTMGVAGRGLSPRPLCKICGFKGVEPLLERNNNPPLYGKCLCTPSISNIKIKETLIYERGSEKQKIRFIDTESVVNFIIDLTHTTTRAKSVNQKKCCFLMFNLFLHVSCKKLDEKKVKNLVLF